jgi:hypothetical protein
MHYWHCAYNTHMVISIIDRMRGVGLEVECLDTGASDEVMRVQGVEFAVVRRVRAPYPNEIAQIEARRLRVGASARPLLVAPFVSESVGDELIKAGWSWADELGNYDLRAPGLVLRQRTAKAKVVKPARTLPQGSGSLAIVRTLIRQSQDVDPTALAAMASVSQPRASQVLTQLTALGLIERTGRRTWCPDRAALLDRFLEEYRGPGGSISYQYSLAPLTSLAVTLAETQRRNCVMSADVGADLVAPWRQPSVLVVYARNDFDLRSVDRVLAQGRDDANVIIHSPADRSVFPNPTVSAAVHGVEVPLADPTQMMWDLMDLGGADRLEAAGVIREWILTSP